MRNNITEFPLNKEDIMRLKPEDICGRVWKASKYGSADISNNNDKRLKVVRNVKRTQPAKINETIEKIRRGRLAAVKPSRRYLVSGQAILEELKRSRVLVY